MVREEKCGKATLGEENTTKHSANPANPHSLLGVVSCVRQLMCAYTGDLVRDEARCLGPHDGSLFASD